MGKMAAELLVDINKDTVDFTDNFDGSLQEPRVLPARLPQLLLNGASGIAVGMATNIPPHNLRELAAALDYMIDEYDRMDDIDTEKLMSFIPGPDFPTGGQIIGADGIKQAYSTGKGPYRNPRAGSKSKTLRATDIGLSSRRFPIRLINQRSSNEIAELVRSGRIVEISDLRDESDRARDEHRDRIEARRPAQESPQPAL